MWQIAWMWNLIPSAALVWVINIILVAGVLGIAAGWIGRWIPVFGIYARLLKPIGIVLLLLGVYFKGGQQVEQSWRDRVAQLEEQVKQSEAKSRDANKQLDAAVKDKIKVVKETKIIIQERIKSSAVKIDQECRLDSGVIDIHNDSATAPSKVKK